MSPGKSQKRIVDDVDALLLDQRQDLLGRTPREGQGRFPFLVLSAAARAGQAQPRQPTVAWPCSRYVAPL